MRKLNLISVILLVNVFLVVIISQIFLKNEISKNRLSFLHNIESEYVYSEQNIKTGYIVIENSMPSDNLFLLQNGEKLTPLNKKQIKINITDNSVIEVDGRNTNELNIIKISDISENTDGFYEREVQVESNIVILGRFFVK